jgi:hypothetical protein
MLFFNSRSVIKPFSVPVYVVVQPFKMFLIMPTGRFYAPDTPIHLKQVDVKRYDRPDRRASR